MYQLLDPLNHHRDLPLRVVAGVFCGKVPRGFTELAGTEHVHQPGNDFQGPIRRYYNPRAKS